MGRANNGAGHQCEPEKLKGEKPKTLGRQRSSAFNLTQALVRAALQVLYQFRFHPHRCNRQMPQPLAGIYGFRDLQNAPDGHKSTEAQPAWRHQVEA